MILGYATLYHADASEAALPDASAARRLLQEHRPDIITRLQACIEQVARGPEGQRFLDAALLGTARLGLRHGRFGKEFQH